MLLGIEGQEKQTGGGHCYYCRSAFLTGAARVIPALQEGNGKAVILVFVPVAVVSLGSSEVLVAAGTAASSI